MKLLQALNQLFEKGKMLPQDEATQPIEPVEEVSSLAAAPTKDLQAETSLPERFDKYLHRPKQFVGSVKFPAVDDQGNFAGFFHSGVLMLPEPATPSPKKYTFNFQSYAGPGIPSDVAQEIFTYWIDRFEITDEEQYEIDQLMYKSFSDMTLAMGVVPLTWRATLMRDIVSLTGEIIKVKRYNDIRILTAFMEAIFIYYFLYVWHKRTLGDEKFAKFDVKAEGLVSLFQSWLEANPEWNPQDFDDSEYYDESILRGWS